MRAKTLQKILKQAGFYDGRIDGQIGPMTRRGINVLINSAKTTRHPGEMSFAEQKVAAGQAALIKLGFEPGPVDGYWGHNTAEAVEEWLRSLQGKEPQKTDREPVDASGYTAMQRKFPRQRDMHRFYGRAGNADCTRGVVKVPMGLRIAWAPDKTIYAFRCHRRLAKYFQRIFDEAIAHYGEERFRELGLDLYGGCFNNRRMRGGKAKSTHAYGAALDLDPANNRLRWGKTRATFARSEYDAFFDICAKYGAVSLGRMKGYDYMHIQFARF